ncbi:hypothetical protein SAMN05421813_10233 [Daejeonella rubra]|uniref:Uncharacterized protein n=1 Tax=Daejeonella rubra TaxID=990371 RepID=A0A1G9MM06_9SPHI|nr:hypothetical protein [Daejeonella rubra]SDL75300.1 hypothetical protein SAMN05421813_10233 [Daejeonella rubra]
MKKYLIFLFFLSNFNDSVAQISTDSLEYRIRPDSLKTGELHLSVQSFNFMRNYEYFNKIQDGYTLFGTQLEPQLVYYAHPRLAVTAGVHLQKDFGAKGIYRTLPLFSIKYQNGHTTLINGVLEGNIHHRMAEPLFDFEKRITEPVEYGTQFIINKNSLFLDAFINWKRMIYKPSPVQEQILGGLSADFRLIRNSKIDLSIPLQLTVFHQGGQIDITPEPLQTLVNTALGFKLKIPLTGFVNAVRSENYLMGFNDFSFTDVQAFSKGHGWYLNTGIDTHYGSLIGTYWNGMSFISSNGMPLYQSVSQHIDHAGFTEKNRKLIMLRYSYQKQLIPNLYLDFRFEPFMDMGRPAGTRKIEFSNSSFLVYKQSFRLLKSKAER